MKNYVDVMYLNGNVKVSLPFLCRSDASYEPLSVAFFTYSSVHAISLKPESLWNSEVWYSHILFSNAYYTRCWYNPPSLLSVPML